MKTKCWAYLIVIILVLSLMVACDTKNTGPENKGTWIDGTWSGQSGNGDYELTIKIDSADFTTGHESVSGNATFSFQQLSDDWRSSEKKTIQLSSSDLVLHYYRDYVTVAFSYGRALSQMVTITINRDGTSYFETPLEGPFSITRN